VKKALLVLIFISLLSGCSTYRFERGKPPYDNGYVVARNGYPIIEYTVGKDDSVPDMQYAQERFKRRKETVEEYYEKMGLIESRFRQYFWDPPAALLDFVGGVFRLPFIAISDYKYRHDPKYKEKMDKLEEEKYAAEKKRVKLLRQELSAYIQKDLVQEQPLPEKPKAEEIKLVKQEEVVVKPQEELAQEKPTIAPLKTEEPILKTEEVSAPVVKEAGLTIPSSLPVQEPAKLKEPKPQAKEELTQEVKKLDKDVSRQKKEKSTLAAIEKKIPRKTKEASLLQEPEAVIIAKPIKGYSPLKVNFYGYKSHSPNGRIVAYSWDFGDGDTSTKSNPINTYWSVTFGSRVFTATLTITDDKGKTATSSITIEVLTK
jgi:hypothetical protein